METAPWYNVNLEKANAWILIDPTNGANGGCVSCVQSATNWDWAAPYPRHMDMCNVGYVDGHVKTTRIQEWYYGNSPWLDPARGG